MIRRPLLALGLVVAVLATLALAPATDARPDRKRGDAPIGKQADPPPEPADEDAKPAESLAEPRPAIAFDNAAAPIRESDIPATAVATGRPLPRPPASTEGPSFLWAAVKVVIALGAVLAALLGISHLLKKSMDRFDAGGATPGRAIAVTEALRVGPGTRVMVIEALGNRYLLGVTPSRVTLLDKAPAGRPEEGA